MSHLHQILTPLLGYHRVKFKNKRLVGYLVPVLMAAVLAVLSYFVPKLKVTGNDGLIDSTLPLLSLLVGFYVAGLGITISLSDSFLDVIRDDAPTGASGRSMSWREFLIALFEHLVASSLLAFGFGVASQLFRPLSVDVVETFHQLFCMSPEIMHGAGRAVVAFGYTGLLCHIMATTMFALTLVGNQLQSERRSQAIRDSKGKHGNDQEP